MMRRVFLLALLLALVSTVGVPATGHAQAPASGEFFLQVTPSPLVTTLKPGIPTELELKIRNAGTTAEDLKIEPRSFKLTGATGQVQLDDTRPPDISQWVSFSAPTFKIRPGEWYTQKVRIALPKEAGFSYSFALLISRKDTPQPTSGGRLIKGSVAVFTLVNVDRPGSTRKLDVAELSASKNVYEYLPAELTIKFRNSGNSIVQPYGNVYIQRGADDAAPITTLPVNTNRSYILPDSTRSITTSWTSGFPAYKDDRLVWDWAKVADLRVGKYTAKLVAVYDDGRRDVPVEKTVSFWVIPWKILLGLLVVALLVLFATGTIIWKIVKLFRRSKRKKPVSDDKPENS